jgi:peroxiredoxin
MHELLYAAAPAAAGAWFGARAWAQGRRALNAPVGQPAPSFDLMGTDGRSHSLDSIHPPVVVLVFMSNRCPGVKAYDRRLRRLAADGGPDVAFVGINPMDERLHPREGLDDMRREAAERRLPFLYLKDADGAVARAYDAVCTPEVVVLDAQRRIRYRGRIDDSLVEADVRQRYLADAIRALRKGRRLHVTETAPLGCSIDATLGNSIVKGARLAA